MVTKRFFVLFTLSLVLLSVLVLVNASPRSGGDLECNMKAEQIAKTMRAEREGLSLEDYGNLWNGYSSEDYATACITITSCGENGKGCCAIIDKRCSCVYDHPNGTPSEPPVIPTPEVPKKVLKAPPLDLQDLLIGQ